MTFYDLIVIGGGPAGLMAACAAGRHAGNPTGAAGSGIRVAVLEKMPRPGRKLMLTGKGRCNLTNVKDWEDFQAHVHPNPRPLRPAFYELSPGKLLQLMEQEGLETVVERGDRAFPASHRAADVVDCLERMARRSGARIFCGKEVCGILRLPDDAADGAKADAVDGAPHQARFAITCTDGSRWQCRSLILATGGLSYPTTGSSGDGLRWAGEMGLDITPLFPSLTALVPKGYKEEEGDAGKSMHIGRSTPLSTTGKLLCGVHLKNVGLTLYIDKVCVREEQGDIDFTDGGLEGPLGFRMSRQCVHALRNGSRAGVEIDLKPGISEGRLAREGKNLEAFLPRDIARAFEATAPTSFPEAIPKGLDAAQRLAYGLKHWHFEIAGYVGYERCVVTAGGVHTGEISPKTMESKKIPGLYLAGELLDLDADTGGYNLQIAFSTGFLAGRNAAQAL